MSVDSIFAQIADHMVKGLMVHSQLSSYYLFIGLPGYSREQRHHYMDESDAYMSLCNYYIAHHNKLITPGTIQNPDIISDSWYRYTRQDVDQNTKRTAVKDGMQKWLDWEVETKVLYERLYRELIDINEIASAKKVEELICDVTAEVDHVLNSILDLMAVDYDMEYILSVQKELYHTYRV